MFRAILALSLALIVNEPQTCQAIPDSKPHPMECMSYWLEEAGVPREERNEWMDVAFCESKFAPHAIGDGGDSYGLYQINLNWHMQRVLDMGYMPESLLDPITNIKVAMAIKDGNRSWGLWSCRTAVNSGARFLAPEPEPLEARRMKFLMLPY